LILTKKLVYAKHVTHGYSTPIGIHEIKQNVILSFIYLFIFIGQNLATKLTVILYYNLTQ